MNKLKELVEKLCGNNYTTRWNDLNYNLIPVTVVNASLGNEISWNDIYQELLKDKDYFQIVRTKSGGISIHHTERLKHIYKYDVKQKKSVVEITLCNLKETNEFRSYRIQWRINNYKDAENNEQLITGKQSFNIFKKHCNKYGINLDDYIVSKEEGIELNKQIHAPDIRLMNPWLKDAVFTNANHLDFHKFYMMGLMKSHPEFEPVIKELNAIAKLDKKYKTVLAATIGYMHSECCNYKYTKLAKDAINRAYEDYYNVMEILKKSNTIIATNTDGIWYTGKVFHGLLESDEIGGWSNDHVNCKIRFKSAGSYEFIEDGKYYPVVRGRTVLDKYKDRSEWQWGDIYLKDAKIQVWTFKEGVGIVWQELK